MKTQQMTQVDLVRGCHQMTTWLNADSRIRPKAVLELKGQEGELWTITKVYDTRSMADIDNHGWDNNDYSKHTGLFSK